MALETHTLFICTPVAQFGGLGSEVPGVSDVVGAQIGVCLWQNLGAQKMYAIHGVQSWHVVVMPV